MIERVATYYGKRMLRLWSGIRNFYEFLKSLFRSFQSLRYLQFRSIYQIAVNQTRFTGIDALPFVVFISLILGGTVIVQSLKNFPKFGIEGFIGNLLVIIIARELGPLVTSLIVISRSGSAMASEIATQKQNREIHSLEIMGIDTMMYIVFPRVLATTVSLLALNILFDIVAFFGGYLISLTSVFIPASTFMTTLIDAFSFKDLLATLLKSVINGMIIPLMSSYYGFMPNSKFEIPIYVSKAVIRTLVTVIIINAIVSALFYF